MCITPLSTGMDLPSSTPALSSPALSPSFQLRSPTNCFSSDITCCYHGSSCCSKTELFDLHPVAPNLRQNVEGSHSVTTVLSGVLWVPTQTEVLGHDVVGMETLWLRRGKPMGGWSRGRPFRWWCEEQLPGLSHQQPRPHPNWTRLPTSSGSLQPLVSHN